MKIFDGMKVNCEQSHYDGEPKGEGGLLHGSKLNQ